jgi:hypothetical protein
MLNQLDPDGVEKRAMTNINFPNLPKSASYVPALDSFKTGLKFLEQNKMLFDQWIYAGAFKEAASKITSLQESINISEGTLKYLSEKREAILSNLKKYGAQKSIRKYSKHIKYYQSYVDEYKSLLDKPDKAILMATRELHRLPAFQKFFSKNSELASFFRLPGNEEIDERLLAGLQTRSKVLEEVKQRLGSGSSGGEQLFQQKLQDGQNQLVETKALLAKFGQASPNSSGDYAINNQKSKNVLRRLKFGMDLQTTRRSGIFPVTTDVSFSVGYAISDKIVTGLGLAGKIGWGDGFDKMSIS